MSSLKFLKTPAILLLSIILIFMILPFSVHAENFQSAVWTMQKDTKIIWASTTSSPKADKDLEEQVYLFNSWLSTKLNIDPLPIVYEPASQAEEHDIVLFLDKNLDLSSQSYEFKVEKSKVLLLASDKSGLFNACTQFIKDLLANNSISDKYDSPVIQQRAVFLDIARNYYSIDNIKSLIREMSWNSYNQLYIHFLDNSGLGIESQTYPWLNGRDSAFSRIEQSAKKLNNDSRQLSQSEVKDIANYAKKYNVSLVPSIEIPAHTNYLIKKFADKSKQGDWSFKLDGQEIQVKRNTEIANYFQYAGQTMICSSYCGSTQSNSACVIDITNPIACVFLKSLISEYAQVFIECGSAEINLGGSDPFSDVSLYIDSRFSPWQQLDHWKALAQRATGNKDAVAYDAYSLCLNDFNKYCIKLGYKCHLWDSGVWVRNEISSNEKSIGQMFDPDWKAVNGIDKNISVLFNGKVADPDLYFSAGYQLYNFDNYFSTYVAGFNSDAGERIRVNAGQIPSAIFDNWTCSTFVASGKENKLAVENFNILGCGFIVWGNDNPDFIKESDVLNDIIPSLQARSMKFWTNSYSFIANFAQYETYYSKIGNAPALKDFTKHEIKNETTQSGSSDFNVQPILLFSAVALIVILFCTYKFVTRKKIDEVFYNYPRQ